MRENETPNENRKSNRQIKFRVTEEEYAKLMAIADQTGTSIPSLCKKKALGLRMTTPKISIDQGRELLLELRKQGNNLNQMARKVNANDYYSPSLLSELHAIRQELTQLWAQL